MANGYVVTWRGFYVHVEPDDKGWQATVSRLGESASPGKGKPVKSFKGRSEDDVVKQAHEAIAQFQPHW